MATTKGHTHHGMEVAITAPGAMQPLKPSSLSCALQCSSNLGICRLLRVASGFANVKVLLRGAGWVAGTELSLAFQALQARQARHAADNRLKKRQNLAFPLSFAFSSTSKACTGVRSLCRQAVCLRGRGLSIKSALHVSPIVT